MERRLAIYTTLAPVETFTSPGMCYFIIKVIPIIVNIKSYHMRTEAPAALPLHNDIKNTLTHDIKIL